MVPGYFAVTTDSSLDRVMPVTAAPIGRPAAGMPAGWAPWEPDALGDEPAVLEIAADAPSASTATAAPTARPSSLVRSPPGAAAPDRHRRCSWGWTCPY